MNETLEQMARAIFKSWFVDFGPFRDKGMVDSPLGEIPKGWKVGTVGQLCILARDGLLPGDFPNETFAHYSIPAYDDGREPKLELGAEIKSNKFLVPEGAVLLSKLNPRFPRVWFANPSPGIRSICSTEFLACMPALAAAREFLYGLFTSDAFLTKFATLVTGTSSSHQRVRPEGLLDIEVVAPDKGALERYAATVGPLLRLQMANRTQSRTLAAIRDALLPKLMSGEVRVNENGSSAN
jgi:type I restriction enzyme, S subunit